MGNRLHRVTSGRGAWAAGGDGRGRRRFLYLDGCRMRRRESVKRGKLVGEGGRAWRVRQWRAVIWGKLVGDGGCGRRVCRWRAVIWGSWSAKVATAGFGRSVLFSFYVCLRGERRFCPFWRVQHGKDLSILMANRGSDRISPENSSDEGGLEIRLSDLNSLDPPTTHIHDERIELENSYEVLQRLELCTKYDIIITKKGDMCHEPPSGYFTTYLDYFNNRFSLSPNALLIEIVRSLSSTRSAKAGSAMMTSAVMSSQSAVDKKRKSWISDDDISSDVITISRVNRRDRAGLFWDLSDPDLGWNMGKTLTRDHDVLHLLPQPTKSLAHALAWNACQVLSLASAFQLREERSRNSESKLHEKIAMFRKELLKKQKKSDEKSKNCDTLRVDLEEKSKSYDVLRRELQQLEEKYSVELTAGEHFLNSPMGKTLLTSTGEKVIELYRASSAFRDEVLQQDLNIHDQVVVDYRRQLRETKLVSEDIVRMIESSVPEPGDETKEELLGILGEILGDIDDDEMIEALRQHPI
ncbi:putative RNA polymerase II transcription factor B subunit 1-1 [Dorcoceras hygrometricum]|uniref:Putative RNA polymerase II transcription factor B subunit 1-1 n=1 Tax=Dorcoceras hygrometricum TaxID=472368 RepID=A0A2Z7B0J0_9LAMI|nr:putative RNA polymerase II transcription factor B subunit 1-1 [Dorcoceras hygrometricum]